MENENEPDARHPALVRVATAGGVRTLTLDSPANRNALSTPLMTELLAALAGAVADDAVRAVVLSHTGPVFCSGADLKETAAAYATGRVPTTMLGDVLAAIWECPKPVLARVAGPARAGGLGLIAAADIAVCAEAATFAFTEVRIGVIPAVISATVLRRLHPRAAAELYLTGETFDGRRAAEIGLVTAAVPADALDAAVAGYTDSLVRGAPGALAGVKELLHRRPGCEPSGDAPGHPRGDAAGELRGDPGGGLRGELVELTALSTRYFLSDEGREGVSAFREKRPARWVPPPVRSSAGPRPQPPGSPARPQPPGPPARPQPPGSPA